MRNIINLFLLSVILLSSSCVTLDKFGDVAAMAASSVGVNPEYVKSGVKVVKAGAKAREGITPKQEYYIGRSVAASLLHKYKVYDKPETTHYLNVIGQTLAMESDRPETFGGYHFLIMDTEEINAFGCPGGLIIVSRGLLRCCKTEDSIAAVLAHEIGHVQYAHGLMAINKQRRNSFVKILGTESLKTFGSSQVAQLTTALEGTVNDITDKILNSGYDRKFEYQADAAAVTIMARTGYNPNALKQMLEEMEKSIKTHSTGFGKTHPAPKDRIASIQNSISKYGPVVEPKARAKRFKAAMAGI